MSSASIATDLTASVWPFNVLTQAPESMSHSLRLRSADPERSCLPSRVHATENTLPLCPLNLRWGLNVLRSNKSRRSLEDTTMFSPSGNGTIDRIPEFREALLTHSP